MNSSPILITGVGQRVGLHLASMFRERDIPVIGTYRTERPGVKTLREAGVDLVECDFDQPNHLSELLAYIRSTTGRLRAIIHNASDWLPDNDDSGSSRVFQRMMNIHAGVPYQINLALADLLTANSPGPADIIHIGDYVSGRGSKKHIAYAASKAAQDNLTLSFAAKLAPAVKVNSISPALILFNDNDSEAYRAKALAKSLLQREAGLNEITHQVDYLMNSHYVTGRIVHADGGRHLV